jgi:hypothetical protein
VLYAEGKHDEALKAMSAAAGAEDKTEKSPVTPRVPEPARELYGIMLLGRGMAPEALAAFEATIKKSRTASTPSPEPRWRPSASATRRKPGTITRNSRRSRAMPIPSGQTSWRRESSWQRTKHVRNRRAATGQAVMRKPHAFVLIHVRDLNDGPGRHLRRPSRSAPIARP